MPEDRDAATRRQKRKSRITTIVLSSLSALLFLAVIGLAVWRAFATDEYPPTPTIPAAIATNFAYVSDLVGRVESRPPGADPAVLQRGDTVGAGPGALIDVAENAWLRLGIGNGITLFLDENTELELRQITAEGGEPAETVIQINDGRLLATTGSADNSTLVIAAETGAEVRAEEAVLGVTYDRSMQRLDVHCLEGSCTVLGASGPGRALETGDHSVVQGQGEAESPTAAQYDLFQMLGDVGVVPTPTRVPSGFATASTPTQGRPSPTPVTLEPTATLPTFTPRPSPTVRVFPSSTPTFRATPTQRVFPTGSPTAEAGSPTPSPSGTASAAEEATGPPPRASATVVGTTTATASPTPEATATE